MNQPTLSTPRLVLRPFAMSDAPALANYMNDFEISRWTATPPFPYELRHAEDYLSTRERDFAEGNSATFACTLRDADGVTGDGQGTLIGSIGLRREPAHQRAELGYALSRRHWGRGYATEAARRVLQFAFEDLGISRVYAGAYSGNPASIRILEKIGMSREGMQRRHVHRLGACHDLVLFGLLREGWKSPASS